MTHLGYPLLVLPLRRQRPTPCECCGPQEILKPVLGYSGQGGLGPLLGGVHLPPQLMERRHVEQGTRQAEPPSQPTPAQPDASTAPLPEAPVSITLKATLNGHEVLVT